MRLTNKTIIEESLQRIDVLQQHIISVDAATSHLYKLKMNNNFVLNHGNLRSTLIEEELDEWRKLFMWALTIDQPTRDRIKAAAYERYLATRNAIANWINPNGHTASTWTSSDAEEFNIMSKNLFSPEKIND